MTLLPARSPQYGALAQGEDGIVYPMSRIDQPRVFAKMAKVFAKIQGECRRWGGQALPVGCLQPLERSRMRPTLPRVIVTPRFL
jgi:hypothetical protein